MSVTFKAGEYFGSTQRSVNTDGISLFHQQYAPLTSSPVHYHQHAHFCFTLSGAFQEIDSKHKQLIPEGQILIYPKERDHKTVTEQQARSSLFVEFNDNWTDRLKETGIAFDQFSVVKSKNITHLFSRIFREFCHPGPASALLLEGLVLETAVELAREKDKEIPMVPAQVKRVIQLLQEDYSRKWTLNELAAQLDFHPVYLNRLFKHHFGATIHHYLEDVRIERVCEKLQYSNDPVSAIALECGFTDPSHLYKVFLKKKGVRPLEYRLLTRW